MWLSSLWRPKNIDCKYPWGMHFSQKYDHSKPQGRPHEKKIELFPKIKINVAKVGVCFPYFFRYNT